MINTCDSEVGYNYIDSSKESKWDDNESLSPIVHVMTPVCFKAKPSLGSNLSNTTQIR